MTSSPPSPLSNVQRQVISEGEQRQRVSIYAPCYDPYDGYGRMALELVWHLNQMGIETNALGTPSTILNRDTQTDEIQALLQKPIVPTVGGLMLGYPTLREQYSGMLSAGKSVALTMFESTQLPKGWMESLNQCAAVIVPSRWNVEAFKACGVTVPIHYVPLGVSETFQPVKRKRGEVFTFLCWGDRGNRKGWDLAGRAFIKAFGTRQDVKLIVKARDNSFVGDTFTHGGEPLNNVVVQRGDLDEEGLQALYASVDCMVFPSRGEGFGLPPREFAATAGPAICTEWWADDIPQWGYPVQYKMVPAWEDMERFRGLGEWAEADVDHLAKQMVHVQSSNPLLIEYMGQRSAVNIRKLYSWQRFAESVLAIWRDPMNARTAQANHPRTGNVKAGWERRKARQHDANR